MSSGMMTTAAKTAGSHQGLLRVLLEALNTTGVSTNGLMLLLISAMISSGSTYIPFLVTKLRSFIIASIKRKLVYTAVFDKRDEVYDWMMFFMATHPNYQEPSIIDVDSKPSKWHKSKKGKSGEEDDQMEEAKPGFYFTPAREESLRFVFKGTHFWASRRFHKEGDDCTKDQIVVRYASRSNAPLRVLLEHAREEYKKTIKPELRVIKLDSRGDYWDSAIKVNRRSVGSVHLPGGIKEEILDDAKSFLLKKTRETYLVREIPWRRGYLLHGPPGTGKSTLCRVIASELKLPIYEMTLNNKGLDDCKFVKLMSQIPRRCILLIEDVDAAFIKRTKAVEDKTEKPAGMANALSSNPNSKISFSALLNGIDGVAAPEGRLLFLTTNHREQLDAALIRCGRIDREVQFYNASQDQAKDIFMRFYQDKSRSQADIEVQAMTFAQSFVPNIVSISALQGFLLENRDDPDKAIKTINDWSKEQVEKLAIPCESKVVL